jgi:hypothetical protein
MERAIVAPHTLASPRSRVDLKWRVQIYVKQTSDVIVTPPPAHAKIIIYRYVVDSGALHAHILVGHERVRLFRSPR